MLVDSTEKNIAVIQNPDSGEWMRFSQPVAIFEARSTDEVESVLETVEHQTRTLGFYAAGFIAYEAAPAFDPALPAKGVGEVPLAWFGIYQNYETVDFPAACSTGTEEEENHNLDWHLLQDEREYGGALEKVRNYIRDGDTYQVNYSFRLRARCDIPFQGLFVRMVHAQNLDQQPGYCAYIETDRWVLCSASPELFFRYHGRSLESRPMKGTAPRGLGSMDDLESGRELLGSQKNRAENIMIADMVRNDMGKIADTGSVHTRNVLQLEKYPTFWTMTTTVECRTDPSPLKVFRALFPAASITGAPKVRAMEIIDELESLPRNVYTGTAGYFSPHGEAQFNVAIRSVLIDKINRDAEFGVGGGIVWDSRSSDEYNECQTKARVLTYSQPAFDLIETLKWSRQGGFLYHDRHLSRLTDSAEYFSWKLDRNEIAAALQSAAENFPSGDQRVRLLVSRNGRISVENSDLESLPDPYRLRLAKHPVNSRNYFLYHKTTHRKVYETAREDCPDCDDVLLWNEKGEVTESCRANVIAQFDGKWFTPPVACGLLYGVERELLLENRTVTESVIPVSRLHAAESVLLINSVRGSWPVILES